MSSVRDNDEIDISSAGDLQSVWSLPEVQCHEWNRLRHLEYPQCHTSFPVFNFTQCHLASYAKTTEWTVAALP